MFNSKLHPPPDIPPPKHIAYNLGDSIATYPPLHLVYVHGFRGDHTSFQRFPTDLHSSLDNRIPSLQSHVYPTYKSRKPLQFAVERLMTWMNTLEPGFIVLIGHSLGGFVVAEAGLQWKKQNSVNQVIGVIAIDVPYLGVHPHVIVSGIVSLFPSSKNATSEQDLNDADKVNILTPTDIESTSDSSSIHSSRPSLPPSYSSSLNTLKLPDLTPGPTPWQNTVHFFRKHADDPLAAIKEWIVSHWEHGSMLLDPQDLRSRYTRMEHWNEVSWVNFYTETVPQVPTKHHGKKSPQRSPPRTPAPTSEPTIHFPQPHSYTGNDASVKTPTPPPQPSHSDSSYDLSLRDPSGPNFPEPEPAPFSSLIPFDSTSTDSLHPENHSPSGSSVSSQDEASPSESTSKPNILKRRASKRAAKQLESTIKKQQEAETHSHEPGPPRHFIIRPWDSTPSRSKWERVPVAGASSEVDAHCGIFFRDKNHDYDEFVARVAKWIENLASRTHPEVLGC